MVAGLAGAIGYFTFSSIGRDAMAIIITATAGVAIASYLVAANIHRLRKQSDVDYSTLP